MNTVDFEFILGTLPTHALNMPTMLFWSHAPVLYILLISAAEKLQPSYQSHNPRFTLTMESYRMVISSPNALSGYLWN